MSRQALIVAVDIAFLRGLFWQRLLANAATVLAAGVFLPVVPGAILSLARETVSQPPLICLTVILRTKTPAR
jgi:hypothetical protein